MSVFKKIFLVTILLICISFNFCFAIDENQFATNNESTASLTDSNTSVDTATGIQANSSAFSSDGSLSTPSVSPLDELSTTEDQVPTTVSSVSSVSNTSTITNILNIALIVVGILLILLAIAILLRLH